MVGYNVQSAPQKPSILLVVAHEVINVGSYRTNSRMTERARPAIGSNPPRLLSIVGVKRRGNVAHEPVGIPSCKRTELPERRYRNWDVDDAAGFNDTVGCDRINQSHLTLNQGMPKSPPRRFDFRGFACLKGMPSFQVRFGLPSENALIGREWVPRAELTISTEFCAATR